MTTTAANAAVAERAATANVPAYAYPAASKLNNPTAETAARMTEEQIAEQPVPPEPEMPERVPHPRLTWNRQPVSSLERTYGNIYTHDKVSPAEFINTLLKDPSQVDTAQDVGRQGYFALHNGYCKPDGTHADDAAWFPYEYSGHWSNRLIRATGQRAMSSMLYKDGLRGKVNLIYMDPPYNISFRSNFQVSAELPETDDTLDNIPDDSMTINAFRDAYRDGVHSYLDGIYEQLTLGRQLLADSGSFIIQIGPDNLHQVAMLMGEVFGVENHVATIPYVVSINSSTRMLPEIGSWLVWYAKDKSQSKYRQIFEERAWADKVADMWGDPMVELSDGNTRPPTKEERESQSSMPTGARLYRRVELLSSHTSTTDRSDPWKFDPENYPDRPAHYPKHANAYPCPTGRQWSVSHNGLHSIAKQGRMDFTESTGRITYKRYIEEVPGKPLSAMWVGIAAPRNKQYVVETPSEVLKRVILMTTDPGDLALDLTCGSGAMPVQCETWGRRWIAVDVAAVSIAIARERIATTVYPYHLLKDSPEGHRRDHELAQELLPPEQRAEFRPAVAYGYDPAQGFVNARQMRVSAATLAYGPDPDGSDVIYHPDRTETARNRVRIASGFAVESDTPYRAVSPENAVQSAEGIVDVERELQTRGFVQRMADALETAGIVQPATEGKSERYRVENLQISEQPDITHTGMLVMPDGKRNKAVFYIGSDEETISPVLTRNAATAASYVDGVEYLVMVGFCRDENAMTVNRRYPRLTILQVDAHRDLQLAHLKDGQRYNAFTIISEPIIRLHRQADDGKVRLEVIGINAFDPRKGEVLPVNARNAICIMTDTAYDGESFRARLMNVKEVKRNQRTLRLLRQALAPKKNRRLAQTPEDDRRQCVDDSKWQAAMKTTTTVPFDLPEKGLKVAVKVIDETGTEHMTVLDDPRDGRWY